MNIYQNDCLDQLTSLEDNSVDSIVTDPPYGISFLNNAWDYSIPKTEIWVECLRVLKPGAALLSFASPRTFHRIACSIEDAGFEIRDQIMWLYGSGMPKAKNLKPAHEPIVVARKPFTGSLKANVTEHGTGYFNIDDCRVGPGRWPCNVVTDRSDAIEDNLPSTVSVKRKAEWNREYPDTATYTPKKTDYGDHNTYEDEGCVSRFFYCAKAHKKEKGSTNTHPTVKPLALMDFLVRLVTPHDGVVLDPFMGSGSTGVAALNANLDFIGIEISEDYFNIAQERISHLLKD